jgi:SAM-dependent methyltransferase
LLHRLGNQQPLRRIGIDISRAAVALGRNLYDLDLRCTTLEKAGFPDCEFHLIVMIDVIEHVARPAEFFAEAVRCLRNDGAIFLRTPNADSYKAALGRWVYLYSGLEHVQYLSHESVKWLAGHHRMVLEELWSEGCPSLLPYKSFHPSRLLRLMREPATILGNAFYRWTLRKLPCQGLGADFFAVMRKQPRDASR